MLENSINKNISSNYFSDNNYNYYDEIKAYRNNIIKELKDIDKQSISQINLRNNYAKSYYDNDKLDIDFDKLKKLNKENQKNDKIEDKTVENTLTNKFQLSEEDKKVVDKLKARDAEVRAHEQAHLSAGAGIITGGPTYSYQSGPDGQKYAIGGEVQIDSSAESTPEETISKMQQVRRAALAPAEPSAQDIQVASGASKIEAQARAELTQQTMEQIAEATKINTETDTDSRTESGTDSKNASRIPAETKANETTNSYQNKAENKNLLEIYFKSTSKPKYNFSF